MFEVKVPATSANLGPGFDALGIALRYHGRFVFEETNEAMDISHLALRAYSQALGWMGEKGPQLRVKTPRMIPVGKGLGSSAACIVAGVLAARHVSGSDISTLDLLTMAARIEGHPDNVTPAFVGGLTASGWKEESLTFGKLPLSRKLSFALLIPSFSLPTAKSRSALPKKVDFSDASFNLSQLALSISALSSGEPDVIAGSFGDRLHQPYRFPLIHQAEELIEIAKESGALAVMLSGAGPSLLLLRRKGDPLSGLREKLPTLDKRWKLRLAEADHRGAELKVL